MIGQSGLESEPIDFSVQLKNSGAEVHIHPFAVGGGGTSFPQAAQINPLSFLVKRFVSIIFLTFRMEIV